MARRVSSNLVMLPASRADVMPIPTLIVLPTAYAG
jgi:hypothetical protein